MKHTITLISAVIAVFFTIYAVLDTFVISHVYVVVESNAGTLMESNAGILVESNSGTLEGNEAVLPEKQTAFSEAAETRTNAEQTEAEAGEESETAAATYTEDSYSDKNITIKITEYFEYDTAIYVADIVLSSPEYLKTAFAQGAFGKNITESTSDIAESVGAILAINGDYYGVQEKGYVIRQGVLYRSTGVSGREDLVVYKDGSFEIISESEVSAEELIEKGAWNVLSFGPGLILDGEISVDEEDEVAKAMVSNPRTAIGIIGPLHYVFVTSDGRTDESEGLSLLELAQFMEELGCEQAYNLDGGGSSTMVFNGIVVNNPVNTSSKKHSSKFSGSDSTSSGSGNSSSGSSDDGTSSASERKVSDIVYIGY